MKQHNRPLAISPARRRILKRGGELVSVTLLASSGLPAVLAQEQGGSAERVDPNSQVAQALMYVEDAANAEARENMDAFCHNCRYYMGAADAEEAPCQILMNQLVPAEGWCNAWIPPEEQ